MSNLPKFIALETLAKKVQHGTINLSVQVRKGEIIGVIAKGNKKTLYNSSEKDQNTNQVALEYIASRLHQQLDGKIDGELSFKVNNKSDKIESIELESTYHIK